MGPSGPSTITTSGRMPLSPSRWDSRPWWAPVRAAARTIVNGRPAIDRLGRRTGFDVNVPCLTPEGRRHSEPAMSAVVNVEAGAARNERGMQTEPCFQRLGQPAILGRRLNPLPDYLNSAIETIDRCTLGAGEWRQ